ncbi:MAG: HdeD family acid-resistance protein [Pirellula sp.]|jgi:uncharacterized membrane protein HdeD (DUF308 family)|nr:HdeD family acid-resistance protein [Pirellula sp.]
MPEALRPIVRQLAMNFCERWWIMMIRGIAAVVFGVLCFTMPGLVLTSLVFLFGAYAILDGVFGVSLALFGRKEIEDWWVLLLWGLVGIGAGVLTFANPQITELVLVFYIAAWALASGVLQIALAIRLRKEIEGEWLLIAAGVLSIVTGVALMARPDQGAVALVWVIGSYAIAFGIVLAVLALKTRSFGKRLAQM